MKLKNYYIKAHEVLEKIHKTHGRKYNGKCLFAIKPSGTCAEAFLHEETNLNYVIAEESYRGIFAASNKFNFYTKIAKMKKIDQSKQLEVVTQ